MPGVECWCASCELVTQHYGDSCGVCAARRAAQVTVPLGRVGRERLQSRADSVAPPPPSRAVTIAIELAAVCAAILAFAL